jgi:ACT domain-containing protein
MMMITDTEGCSKDLAKLRHELHQVGQEIGVNIHIQHEEIFEMMHRI